MNFLGSLFIQNWQRLFKLFLLSLSHPCSNKELKIIVRNFVNTNTRARHTKNTPKVRLRLGLLLNNEQAWARTGLGFGPSSAGPNLCNSGLTGSGFKREMDRQADREIDRDTDRQTEQAGRQINNAQIDRETERKREREREREREWERRHVSVKYILYLLSVPF